MKGIKHMTNKKLVLIISIITIIVVLIASNQLISNKYDLNLYEYINYSIPISTEETNYLSEKGTLYFSSDKNAPPFAYIDKNSGQYKGLVLDYVNALSIELGVDIEFDAQVWENVINSVISGDSDMCDIFPSEERMKNFIFSEPIYRLRAIVMTDKKSYDIVYAYDLSGHTVAIPAGDYAYEYINENIPNVKIFETFDLLDSVKAFQEGKVDAVVGDEPVLIHFIDELGINDNVKILDSVLYDKEVSIGVKRDDSQLVNILNKGILNLKKKNSVEKIHQKWFGISAPILKYKVPEKLMLVLIILFNGLILIFVGIAFLSYTLKIEVKKRTDDLNRSRNNLQLTVDSLSSFLIIIDENNSVINENKSFSEYLKKQNVSVEKNNYRNIPILNHIDIGQRSSSENEFIFNGKYYVYTISELNYEDSKYLIVIEDITDKKLSQQQILQQNKMIALGQLAAGVAHEIRNPLGIIQNYCYILKTYIFKEDPIAENSIDVIESSVQRVDKIVNNLLNFSHMENNKLTCINLKESILNIISLENKIILKKNIELKINCNDDIKFITSIESLNHIFLNLLSNSLDSIVDFGKISIDFKVDNEFLIIDFKDTGTGISKENIERIFNPFYTTKKVGQGTGLGLYIVYNEIQKIGGEIQVYSELGIGTTFKMKFPFLKG
jgi:polar amino acid transport system substrate-binding protein